jgi:hypothetical protein
MRLTKVDFKPIFKKELSSIELYGIEAMIREMNEDETFFFTPENLGLAYTSSSDYAMYNICNGGDFYIEEPETTYDDDDNEKTTYIQASHWAITENNMLLLCCYNEEENEVFFEVENY